MRPNQPSVEGNHPGGDAGGDELEIDNAVEDLDLDIEISDRSLLHPDICALFVPDPSQSDDMDPIRIQMRERFIILSGRASTRKFEFQPRVIWRIPSLHPFPTWIWISRESWFPVSNWYNIRLTILRKAIFPQKFAFLNGVKVEHDRVMRIHVAKAQSVSLPDGDLKRIVDAAIDTLCEREPLAMTPPSIC